MKIDQDTHRRWEMERDSLRLQIAELREGRFDATFDGSDPNRITTEESLRDAEARLAEIEGLLKRHNPTV